jgi:hypothetical protein
MSDKVLMKRRGILRSNLDRSIRIGRLRRFLLHRTSVRQGRWGAAPWPAAWAAPSRSKGPHLANRQLLRDLDVERNLFYPLTVAKMDEGMLATRRRLGQSSTAVEASSGGAPALGSAPGVEMMSVDSPPSSGSAREAWSSGAARAGWLCCGGREK